MYDLRSEVFEQDDLFFGATVGGHGDGESVE
jgi:hypothetical protein